MPFKKVGDNSGIGAARQEPTSRSSSPNVDQSKLKSLKKAASDSSRETTQTLTEPPFRIGQLRPNSTNTASSTTPSVESTSIPSSHPYDQAVSAVTKGFITPDDVEKKIQSLTIQSTTAEEPIRGPGLERITRLTIHRVAHEGNIDQINTIFATLRKEGVSHLYSPGTGSLSDVILYLIDKKVLGDGEHIKIEKTTESSLNKNTAIILDQQTIHKLQTNQEFANTILSSEAKLVVPSTISSIGPLSATGLDDSDATFVTLASRFASKAPKKINPNDLHSHFEKSSIELLNESLKTDIHTLKEEKRLIFARPKLPREPSNQDIALSFNRGSTLTAKDVQQGLDNVYNGKRLKTLEPEDHELLNKYIDASAKVYSIRDLSTAVKQQKKIVDSFAKERGINSQDIVFLVPNAHKSYGIVAALFQEHNQGFGQFVTPDQFETMLQPAPQNIIGEKSSQLKQQVEVIASASKQSKQLVVVLDDVAGSGHSLDKVRKYVREIGYEGNLLISPIIASKRSIESSQTQSTIEGDEHPSKTTLQMSSNNGTPAQLETLFDGFSKRESEDSNLFFRPIEQIDGLYDSEFYGGLSEADQLALNVNLDDTGYGNQALLIVFPYMTPNNNARYIAKAIGPHFTLNGKGVKTITAAPNRKQAIKLSEEEKEKMRAPQLF